MVRTYASGLVAAIMQFLWYLTQIDLGTWALYLVHTTSAKVTKLITILLEEVQGFITYGSLTAQFVLFIVLLVAVKDLSLIHI